MTLEGTLASSQHAQSVSAGAMFTSVINQTAFRASCTNLSYLHSQFKSITMGIFIDLQDDRDLVCYVTIDFSFFLKKC